MPPSEDNFDAYSIQPIGRTVGGGFVHRGFRSFCGSVTSPIDTANSRDHAEIKLILK